VKFERYFAQASSSPSADPANSDGFLLCSERLSIEKDGVVLAKLTAKEFQILTLLQNNRNAPVTREQILAKIWNSTNVVGKTFDVHLFHLRKKMEGTGISICFVKPNGYFLESANKSAVFISNVS
jgi:DNA-binding response OmpR family regulator